jgi:hypothetical protein
MKIRFIRRPSPAMVVACLALFVSLSAAGYATTVLPPNSVGTLEVRNGSLKREDFRAGVLPDTGAADTAKIAVTVSERSIVVRNAKGAAVSTVAPGPYEFSVLDRSRVRNFHLLGPGVDRRTGISYVGSISWRVTLRTGEYRYRSDGSSLQGTLRVG